MPDLVESVRLRLNVGLAANWSDRQLALAAIAAVLDDIDATARKLPTAWPETIHEFTADYRRECGLDTTENAA